LRREIMRRARLFVTGIGALILAGCPSATAPHQVGIGGGGGGGRVLAFFSQPVTSHVFPAFMNTVQVEVRDSVTGARDTTATGGVTLALSPNTFGALLSSAGNGLSIAFVSGVATFSDLSVNVTGTGFTLTATSSGLTTITSQSFDIIP
jgi:hypothetical protein